MFFYYEFWLGCPEIGNFIGVHTYNKVDIEHIWEYMSTTFVSVSLFICSGPLRNYIIKTACEVAP